jgi:hypothetical protein
MKHDHLGIMLVQLLFLENMRTGKHEYLTTLKVMVVWVGKLKINARKEEKHKTDDYHISILS